MVKKKIKYYTENLIFSSGEEYGKYKDNDFNI